MKPALLVFVSLILALLGCPPAVSPNPLPVPDTDQCGAMCTQLQVLKCAEGKDVYDSDLPGPAGVPNETCAQDCEKQQNNGVFYNPKCVKLVTSCKDIEAARKKTCN